VLPLYYQVDRGESALNAGLLLAPQGIGAALMLPISGRLTDRMGGGPVVVAGTSIIALATLPFAFVSDHTPYTLLAGVLVVRGLGLGASIQPAAASAYQLLHSSQVPRATAAINALRQVGGSIGTALLAVVLQHESAAALPSTSSGTGRLLAPLPAGERAQISGPVATAFGHTFMWSFAIALLAIVPAVALLRAERADRRPDEPQAATRGRAAAITAETSSSPWPSAIAACQRGTSASATGSSRCCWRAASSASPTSL
jgi:MFS family permease